jgi:hypothetical protein
MGYENMGVGRDRCELIGVINCNCVVLNPRGKSK